VTQSSDAVLPGNSCTDLPLLFNVQKSSSSRNSAELQIIGINAVFAPTARRRTADPPEGFPNHERQPQLCSPIALWPWMTMLASAGGEAGPANRPRAFVTAETTDGCSRIEAKSSGGPRETSSSQESARFLVCYSHTASRRIDSFAVPYGYAT
jgi:hypothetical protein